MVVLMVDLWLPRDRKGALPVISIIGLGITAFCVGSIWNKGLSTFGGAVVADKFSLTNLFHLYNPKVFPAHCPQKKIVTKN